MEARSILVLRAEAEAENRTDLNRARQEVGGAFHLVRREDSNSGLRAIQRGMERRLRSSTGSVWKERNIGRWSEKEERGSEEEGGRQLDE